MCIIIYQLKKLFTYLLIDLRDRCLVLSLKIYSDPPSPPLLPIKKLSDIILK